MAKKGLVPERKALGFMHVHPDSLEIVASVHGGDDVALGCQEQCAIRAALLRSVLPGVCRQPRLKSLRVVGVSHGINPCQVLRQEDGKCLGALWELVTDGGHLPSIKASRTRPHTPKLRSK